MRSDYFGQHFRKCQSVIAILLIATILTITGPGPTARAAAKNYSSVVYKLAHIPAEKARTQLAALGLSVDINKLEKANVLVITTDNPADKIKVASVLNLIDSRLGYEVTKLAFNADTEEIPSTASINAAIRGIEVGSFAKPPTTDVAARAIIDINGQDLILIAPRGLIKPIISGMTALRSAKKFRRKKLISKQNIAGATPAKSSSTALVNTTAVLRLSETSRSSVTVGKTKSKTKTKPAVADSSAGVDLSTLSPTMRQLKEAQRQLAEAFKNAEADSIKEFMKDKTNASQIAVFAKSEPIDPHMLELLKNLQKRTEEQKTKKTKTEKKPKAEPEKTGSEKKRPESRIRPRAIPSGSKSVTPPEKKTDSKAPAAKLKPSKITARPKQAPPEKAPSEKENLADILKQLEALSKVKADPNAATKKPGTEKPVKPAQNIVEKSEPVPAETPGVKKVTAPTKSPSELTELELDTVLTMPTTVKITELLELVGKQLKLNYMYDPLLIKGDVQLYIYNGKIKVRELYSLVESVLKFKGFVMTRNGNLVTVARVTDSMIIDSPIIGEGENVTKGNVIVTKIFKVKHIDTATAQKTLTDMRLGISIQSIPEYGKMIITGYAYRMDRIQKVLDMVDLPGKIRVFRYRMLDFLTPSELAPKLQVLANELKTISISVSSKAAAAAKPARVDTSKMSTTERRKYAIDKARRDAAERLRVKNSKTSASTIGAATSKTVYLDIDDRTNRILMIGLSESVDIVEDLIDVLDVKRQGIRLIRQYKIQFVDASMVIDILSELGVTAAGARPVTPVRGRTPLPSSRGASPGDGPKISLLMETNSLLINATYEKHEEIMVIIDHVDVENPDERTIKRYEIEHVDTQEILDTLMELGITTAPSSGSSNSRYGSTTKGRLPSSKTPPRATTPAVSSSFSEPMADEPQIAVLETTNSLLVNATARQHASIEMVKAFVDVLPDTDSTPYVVYQLGNQDPIELKKELDVLVDATIAASTDSAPSKSGSSSTAKIINTRKSSGTKAADERITIVADEETRSLVVYASKKNQKWIGDLIATLDAYRSQVLLDVTLVEISKDNEFILDLDLVTKAGGLIPGDSFTQMTKAGISGVSGLIGSGDWGRRIAEAGVTNGSGKAFYADRHIQGLFELMDKKNYGRVLARPSILVKDNQEGEINATKTIYVGQEKTNVITGTTSNLSTTSDVTFTDYSSGITLTITPHIASDKLLQLDILLDRTDFDPSDPGTATFGDRTVPKPLNTVSSKVGTTAILPNGATIILGGIETITQTKSVTKIPILGDIPIIGALFRGIDESDKQTKLYVFVKANIIRPGDELTGTSDIERISRKKRDAFEAEEVKFQKLRAVPGIEPNPMDPQRILEDDEYLESLKAIKPKNYIDIQF